MFFFAFLRQKVNFTAKVLKKIVNFFIIFHFDIQYLRNRWYNFEDFFCNCCKFNSLFISIKTGLWKNINFQPKKLATGQNLDPIAKKRTSNADSTTNKFVGIRQNLNRWNFRLNLYRPVLFYSFNLKRKFNCE